MSGFLEHSSAISVARAIQTTPLKVLLKVEVKFFKILILLL